MKRVLSVAALALGLFAASDAQAACGKVTISDMDWTSASLIANVDKVILEAAYGCEVELVPGSTNSAGASMTEKGEPDIAPEFWANNFKEALALGVEEKRLRVFGAPLKEAAEGFFVPKFMVDKDPSLATIEGVLKNAKMFPHPEDSSKSGFMGCPSGWGCQKSSKNLVTALGLDKAGFEIIDPGTAAGLDGSIVKANERSEAWFGYYWAPTALLARYPMVMVDFGSGIDAEHFTSCIAQDECADPKPTMYPPSNVVTVTTERFAMAAPEAMDYLAKRGYGNQVMHDMLVWADDNQAPGEDAAAHFLKTYEAVWSEWLSADAAAMVKKAVADM